VKKLVLFHHDPLQSDAQVAEKEKRAKALFRTRSRSTKGS
jgi:hypothetical protein